MKDDVVIDPDNPTSNDFYSATEDFLGGIPNPKAIATEFSANSLKLLGLGAAIGATPEVARRTGLTNLLQLGMFNASEQSTKIGGYYNPGADKIGKQLDHFGLRQSIPKGLEKIHPILAQGPTSDANRQVVQFLKNAQADSMPGTDYEKSSTKALPHKKGLAIQRLVELEVAADVPIGERTVRSGPLYNDSIRNPIDPTNPKQVRRIQGLLRDPKVKELLNISTPAQLNAEINADFADRGNYSSTTARRWNRHEKISEELIKHVNNKKNVDYARMAEAGVSEPQLTQANKVFKNHPKALQLWDTVGERNVTHSAVGHVMREDKKGLAKGNKKGKIIGIRDIGGDRLQLLKSGSRDMQYAMGKKVAKFANLNSVKSIKEVATLAAEQFIDSPEMVFESKRKMHPSVESYKSEIDRFMNNYRIDKGKLHINFSPRYKPHFLLGGVNADATFWRGPRGGLKSSLLVSDFYDLGTFEKLAAQRNTHITTAFRSDDKQALKDYYQSLENSPSNTQRLKTAIQDKDGDSIKKYAKSTIKRTGQKVGRAVYTKNPIVNTLKSGGKAAKILSTAVLLASLYKASKE